jgi:hypothetical protein
MCPVGVKNLIRERYQGLFVTSCVSNDVGNRDR